ncbi:MAG: YicC/YloC family endoribonuclease [Akkermansiaceae bacterium]|nr:YicC/YloC family endoribonuclease [Akkermansiaceae bacterium]
MQSMTGFGRGSGQHEGVQASVEISTVNRKQAEVVIQMPRELAELESSIRKTVLGSISRGRAQVSIKLEQESAETTELKVDQGLASALQQAMTQLGEELGQDLTLSASDLLSQPELVSLGEAEIKPDRAMAAISPALSEALTALQAMRAEEGKHLKEDFLTRLDRLKGFTSSLAKAAPARPERYRELLMKRLADAGLELDLEDERVLREIALFADRCDISEELTRLHSHFAKFSDYLESGEPCGRPLDFLCQELFREFNTIGSKANDARIAQTIVEAKTELEKIREQVQNVE